MIQVAKTYECGNCSSDVQRKLAKPGSLPQATHFNELVEVDTFHVKWNDKRIHILGAIDIEASGTVSLARPASCELTAQELIYVSALPAMPQ